MDRMLPYDHFMILFETEKSPMNIGALLLFDVPEKDKSSFAARVRAHLEKHVPRSVLARRLIASPEHYDTDSWFRLRSSEAMRQIQTLAFSQPLSNEALRAFVTERAMQHLDLGKAPFEMDIIGDLEGAQGAIYFKSHHSVMDGVGFVSMISQLSDSGVADLAGTAAEENESPPDPDAWMALAREKFEREEMIRAQAAERKANAEKLLSAFLSDPRNQRLPAPDMAFGAEFSKLREYRTISFPFDRFRAVAKRCGVSINDVFLTIAAGAMRDYLAERGQLPQQPLISHSVRSIRREEHGAYNNWVLSLYPELATDEPDVMKRLHRIRSSMNVEKNRSTIEEDFLDLVDWPYGARDRRAACSDINQIEAAIGPANVVLSNVPGPSERLTFAGFPLAANYPVPIVGPSRFLNITSRRNADALDMGVMTDAAKIKDADAFAACLWRAFDDIERVSEDA
ncbi:MAG: wax ester/triacylglycerol synthase domain-containing protein [Caulobacterales bacterium]